MSKLAGIESNCRSNIRSTRRRVPPTTRDSEEIRMTSIQLVTSKQVSGMISVAEGTLRYWRNVGLGPVWHKLEGSIRYSLKDVHAYVENSRRIPSVRAYMEERYVSI
jgi:hypothetical protein